MTGLPSRPPAWPVRSAALLLLVFVVLGFAPNQARITSAAPQGLGSHVERTGLTHLATSQAAPPLLNGDFEERWLGWRFVTSWVGVGNMHPQAARSGGYGALIRGAGRIEQRLEGLAPNTRYTLSGFVRATSARSRSGLRVSGYADGAPIIERLTSGDQWEQLSLSFTTGPGSTSALISFVAPLSDDRIHYADELRLSLYATTPAPQPAPPPSAGTRAGYQYEPLELTLTARASVANPYRDLTLSATFTSPTGRTLRAGGFWDGGTTWRVRFTPTEPGPWRYQISNDQGDPGLAAAGLIVAAPARPGRDGFLRADRAYPQSVVFDSGRRPLLLGTTAYTLARTELGGGNWRAFVDGSLAHGITRIRTLVHPWNVASRFPYRAPFLANDHDQPDLAYWQALDRVVAYITGRGLIVDLILFADEPQAFGTPAQDERYVRFILARYAANPLVIWTLSNEWEYTGKGMSYWNRIGALVAAEDPYATNAAGARRLLSIHNKTGGSAGGRFAFFGQSWPSHAVVQYGVRNGVTPHGDVWAQQSILRNAGRGLPVLNDELAYFGEQATTSTGPAKVDRETQRRALWAAYVAGGSATVGDASAVEGAAVWHTGLWNDLGPAHDDLLRLQQFFSGRSLPFWAMTSRNDLVTAGTRAYALAGERDLVLYAAVGGPVQLALPAGPWEVTRFDPRSGATQALGVASGSARWSLDGNDWVLHLRRP